MKIRVYLKVRRKELLVRNSDILNLKCWVYMFLLLLEDIGLVVGLKSFLMIKVKPVDTFTNEKLPRKSKINQFKNDYAYLIDQFLKFTVKFGFDFGLVDFKIVSIDSTPIEAYVDEFRILSIGQITYLEDLIYDYSFDKSKRLTWNKIKRFFFMDELPDDMIDLIDENTS